MKRIIWIISVLMLICSIMSAYASIPEEESFFGKMERIIKGNLTDEEALLDCEGALDLLPKQYKVSAFNQVSSIAMALNTGVAKGDISEELALKVCVLIGNAQKKAKEDYSLFTRKIEHVRKYKSASVLISFSAGVAINGEPGDHKHGIVYGDRDTDIKVIWDDGTISYYKYEKGVDGKGILTRPMKKPYEEQEKDDDFDVLFFTEEQLKSGVKAKEEVVLIKGISSDEICKGDIIYYGNYPQSLDDEVSPIEWLVVEKNGSKVKLLSKMSLAMKRFHGKDTKTSWASCDLRKWLNNTFLKTAFSPEEQKKLEQIKREGSSDKVTLISIEEAEQIFDGYSEYLLATGNQKKINELINGEYTLYAYIEAMSINTAIEMAGKQRYDRYDDWWTCQVNRKNKDWAICQDKSMTALEWADKKCTNIAGVRPMIKIDLDKVEYYVQTK